MTKATDAIAPSSNQTVMRDVEQYLEHMKLENTTMFEHYDDALRAVWPHLHASDPYAAIFLAIAIYLESAEKRGFEVRANFLKAAGLDTWNERGAKHDSR